MQPQSRAHRKPPDVEEALSSMLWTPYDNNISESDSSDEMEVLHRVNNNSNYSFFGTGANQDQRRYPHRQQQQQQQSLMRRSLSAWSYRSRTGKPNAIGESEAGNRFSYPYYDQPDLGFGAFGGGLSSGWYGYGSAINSNSNNYYYHHHTNGSSYGYTGVPVPSSRSSYSIQPTVEQGRTDERAPWQTLTATADRSNEKRPYLQHQQLQTPFVGRWQSGVGASQLETSSLPYSLLALDSLSVTGAGASSTVASAGREVDGFADSYQDDYQRMESSKQKGNPTMIMTNGAEMGRGNSSSVQQSSTQHGVKHPEAMRDFGWSGQHNSSITASLLLPSTLPYDGRASGVGTTDARISRTPAQPCSTAAVEGEVLVRPGSAVACADSAFNCVRQANATTSTLVRRADGAQADRVRSTDTVYRSEPDRRADQHKVVHSAISSSSSPDRVVAMRLNVPAAGLAEGGSRTSVYIPSTAVAPSEGVGGGLLPALSIQVNRLDPNNQQQNDVVNNAASGVSIVSCYRASSVVASGASGLLQAKEAAEGVRVEEGTGSKCIVERDERGEDHRKEAIDRGVVNTTREHRRRERRERRQARNRLQHIHPLEPPPPLHRSPPPIEIIPDILHSHLPPPYTTLPMGASLIPQMIPANAVAAAAAAAIPVRAADDCRYTFPIPIMRR
uniref:Uncharacterized protein n=1 Tax=Anopheles culicifacies TaxID=139723 RepID=A0A182MLC1_9DIPT